MNGFFVISLDFELYWGVSESKTIKSYFNNLNNTKHVVNKLLNIFLKNQIEATWATVGFLFFNSVEKITIFKKRNSAKIPKYFRKNINNYDIIDSINQNDKDFYFANELIKKINNTDGQEIATHTMSHFYSLERGVNIRDFENEIKNAVKIASKNGIEIKSIVFPRNQYNDEILKSCKKFGINSFRGNENHILYNPSANQNLFRRLLKYIDSYINITCSKSYFIKKNNFLNIPASCFLRPYNKKLLLFEKIKISKILNEMTYAAKNNQVYHLWWHPHNFGKDLENNFKILEKIIRHYSFLNKMYGFKSINMKNLNECINKK